MLHTITPRRGLLDIDIKGLWRYRDLYVMYIKRDIVTKYKQTILGPLWYIIQPLFTTVMYMFVFGGLAGRRGRGHAPWRITLSPLLCQWCLTFLKPCLHERG